MTGQVYALASGKGGVGKTAVTANLGVTLRSKGHSVALVDADLGMANLTTLLKIDHETTLHDILAGEATVEQALTEEADGFALLPGTRDLEGFAAADPDRLGGVLEELAAAYEFVLVDTGGGLSYEDVLPLGLVDGVILVTTPGSAAIGDTRKTGELAEMVDGHVEGVVVNRATESTDAESIAAEVGAALLGTIPEDRNVAESEIAGQPLQAYAPDSPATGAYDRLAAAIAGSESETTAEDTEDEEATESEEPPERADETDEAATGGADASETATEREDETTAEREDETTTEREEESAATQAPTEDRDGTAADADEETEAAVDRRDEEKSGGITGWLGRLFR